VRGRGSQRAGLPLASGRRDPDCTGKTAEAIRQEVAREVGQLWRVIFNGRHKTGRLELRPCYMCPHCHTSHFPADVELDIEDTEKKRPWAGKAGPKGNQPTRGRSSWDACSRKPNGMRKAMRSRLKRSGMFWTVRGGNAILALRCCHFNGRFEDYWEARRA
jgi:hypothetical protein